MQFYLQQQKRRTELYLRALWGREFLVNGHNKSDSKSTPLSYLEKNELFLPSQLKLPVKDNSYYHAAAAHLASHVMYGNSQFEVGDLNFIQRNIIGLVEDLRVELQAIKKLPGLRKLWLGFHKLSDNTSINAQQLMRRLSRCVLDPEYRDEHQWVVKGKKLILDNYSALSEQSISREVGLKLANDLGQMRLPLNSGKYDQPVLYRDDNRCLWQETIEYRESSAALTAQQQSSLQNNKLVEQQQGKKLKLSNTFSKQSEGFLIEERDQADFEYQKQKQAGDEKPIYYPEWDYRIEHLKQNWCSLYEKESDKGSEIKIEEILQQHKFVLNRLKHIANKLRLDKLQKVKKMSDGDELDFDRVVDAIVSARMNQVPDTRVFVRNEYKESKSMAISILLDLSESTNHMIGDTSISELMRDAVVLLAETLTVANEAFSIAGFSSNGRHEINFINFKKYSDSFEEKRAGLANVKGQYSTRLGTAIRHSAQQLVQQSASKKILLVITDGAPSDVDVYDQKYLEYDSWQAVKTLFRQGIKPFCLNLDSRADSAMEHIFGKGHFETLEHLNRLPEVLSRIYIKHGRH